MTGGGFAVDRARIEPFASFDAIADRLGKRESRKLANNTYLVRLDAETIAVRFHSTNVLTFDRDSVTMRDGGWLSMSTKDRLGYAHGLRVWADRGTWIVGNGIETVRYFDGIRFDYAGNCLNPPDSAETDKLDAANKATKRAVSAYVKAATAALAEGLPMPSGGDCWLCSMVGTDGKPWGDSSGDTEHLTSHIEESYFVPSLLVNAVREAGYREPAYILGYNADNGTIGGRYGVPSLVARSLRKYLLKRLLIGAVTVR